MLVLGSITAGRGKRRKKGAWAYFLAHPWLYILMIPGLFYILLFNYYPMYGVIIGFQEFNFVKGISGSQWIGIQNFAELFASEKFAQVLRNSIELSFMRIAWTFPMPILLALLLNEVRSIKFKRAVQTLVYIPHFISWVVVVGIITNILSPTKEGLLNTLLGIFGIPPVNLLTDTSTFRGVIVVAEIWKGAGWGTIIYLSALTRVDTEIYEAAAIDGANRLSVMWHITLPGIRPTIATMLILRLGSVLNNGFEQIFLLYTPLVYEVADVFETYTYRIGIQGGRFSYSTAVGLFQSVVGFVMIMSSNYVSRRLSDSSLF